MLVICFIKNYYFINNEYSLSKNHLPAITTTANNQSGLQGKNNLFQTPLLQF